MSSGNIRKQQYEQELKMQRERELAKKIAAEQLRKTVPVPNAPTGLMTPPLPAPPPNQPVEDHSYKISTDNNESNKQRLVDLGYSEEEISRVRQPNPAGHFQSRPDGKSYYETGPMPSGPLGRQNPPIRKTPTGNEIMMDNARGLMDDPLGSIDRGVGQFFGEDGPIDSAKKSQIGQLLGGFLKHAGGLMSDPELRGFAGMMDEGSYYDEKGYYGGAGQGLATAGGLYDAAAGAGAKRMEARAKLITAAGGRRVDKTKVSIGSGFEAKEFIDRNGKRMWMASVAPGMQEDLEKIGGGVQQVDKYKKGVRTSLEGITASTPDILRDKLKQFAVKKYDGNLLNTGQTIQEGPKMGNQIKMMNEMRNAQSSLNMLHTILGKPGESRGSLGESYLGLGGTLAARARGAVAEVGQIMGQPNWLDPNSKIGKTRKLQTTMSKIKASLWRSLVGRGQLSAADYKFIDDNLGVFSWGKDEGLVRFSLGKVVERLNDVISMNQYLMHRGYDTPEAIREQWAKYDGGDRTSAIYEAANQTDLAGLYNSERTGDRTDIPTDKQGWITKKNQTNQSVKDSYQQHFSGGGSFKDRTSGVLKKNKKMTPLEEDFMARLSGVLSK